MVLNPPAPEDAALLRRLAALHVGPGETFDESLLGLGGTLRWKMMLLQLKSKLTEQATQYARQIGTVDLLWRSPLATFGTEYTYRTMVALIGLGANTTDIAIYPKTEVDSSGNTLTGKRTYKLHFTSFSADGGQRILVGNGLRR